VTGRAATYRSLIFNNCGSEGKQVLGIAWQCGRFWTGSPSTFENFEGLFPLKIFEGVGDFHRQRAAVREVGRVAPTHNIEEVIPTGNVLYSRARRKRVTVEKTEG